MRLTTGLPALALAACTAALDVAAPPEAEPPAPGGAPAKGWEVTLASRSGIAFATTSCGRLYVAETTDRSSRLVQRVGLVELSGWTERPVTQARGTCVRVFDKPRVTIGSPLPEGYRGVHRDAATRLDQLASSGATVYVASSLAGEPACMAWRFAPSKRQSGKGTLAWTHANGRRVEFGYELHDGTLVLLGPDAWGCSSRHKAVSFGEDRVVMLPHPPAGTWAYYAEDADDWYLTEEACRAALERPQTDLASLGCEPPPLRSSEAADEAEPDRVAARVD